MVCHRELVAKRKEMGIQVNDNPRFTEYLHYSGNTVILGHGLGLYSYFGHMSAFSVQVGDQLKTGDIVGKVGATGLVTGPHLHWTVRLVGTRVDPLSLVSLLGK